VTSSRGPGNTLGPTPSYSLEGEDLIARSLLRSVTKGTYLDIGCSDPVEISNTYSFYLAGWRGVAVDGRTELKKAWARERPRDTFVPCVIDEKDGERTFWMFPDPTMNTCDAATAERYSHRFPSDQARSSRAETRSARSIWDEVYGRESCPPDLVSLDVEGNELPILKGLVSHCWKPALLIVECKLFSFNAPFEQPVVNFLCGEFRYVLIAKTPLDAFFIDPDNVHFDYLPATMRNANVFSG